MAEKRISELTAKGIALAATDRIEISESDGGGGWVTKYVTGAQVLSGAKNISTDNIVFTADSDVDLDDYSVFFNNCNSFNIDGQTNVISPSSSFSDKMFRLRKLGNAASWTEVTANGKWGVNGNPISNARFSIFEDSVWALYISNTGDTGIVIETTGGRGIMSDSTSNYGADLSSGSSFALNLRGANGLNYTAEGTDGRSAIRIFELGGVNRIFQVGNSGRIISDTLKNSSSYADDAAAAAGSVEVGQLYRNGSVVQIRIS